MRKLIDCFNSCQLIVITLIESRLRYEVFQFPLILCWLVCSWGQSMKPLWFVEELKPCFLPPLPPPPACCRRRHTATLETCAQTVCTRNFLGKPRSNLHVFLFPPLRGDGFTSHMNKKPYFTFWQWTACMVFQDVGLTSTSQIIFLYRAAINAYIDD